MSKAKQGGFITLHRQILDWKWYRNPATAFLFIHLLLSANFAEGTFENRVIRRGQMVTSLPAISTGTGLSIQQIRTALSHLVSTGEITDESCNRYRIITVVNYDAYQTLTGKSTGNQQATNRQPNRQSTDDLTFNQQQYNNNKEYINKETNITREQEESKERRTAQRFSPPTKDEIEAFCQENGLSIDVDYLWNHYASNGWMVGKNHMKDWQAAVRNWAKRDKQGKGTASRPAKTVVAQQYEQRDYSDIQREYELQMQRDIDAALGR